MGSAVTGIRFQAIGLDPASGQLVSLPFAELETYSAGTLTPLATYTNEGLGSANATTVIMDAKGQADVWIGSAAYRFRLYTSTASGRVLQYDRDNYKSPGAGAESVSSYNSGTLGNGVADDAPALRAAKVLVETSSDPATYASNSPANGPATLFIPSGYYLIGSEIVVTKKVAFRGDGPAEFSSGTRLLGTDVNANIFRISPIAQGMSVSFEDMTLRGSGAGTGDLIKIAVSGCNSQRYRNLVFGTPSSLSLNIQGGDDVTGDNILFDVSAGSALSLGSATGVVGNAIFTNCNWFQVPTHCILLYNVVNVSICNPRVYPSADGNRIAHFINATDTLPVLVKDLSIIGGTLKNVNCMLTITAGINISVTGTICDVASGGSSARSFFEFFGTNAGLVIQGVTVRGDFGTKHVYEDQGGTVSRANITGNVFENTGAGTARALRCANTTGVIKNNTFIGFDAPSVSEKVYTSGNAVSAGVINSLLKYSKTFTVTDANVFDTVEMGTFAGTWPAPVGIEIRAYVSAANTVTVEYRNVSAAPIGVPDHDIWYMVTRG